jgi:hypothetical protein
MMNWSTQKVEEPTFAIEYLPLIRVVEVFDRLAAIGARLRSLGIDSVNGNFEKLPAPINQGIENG